MKRKLHACLLLMILSSLAITNSSFQLEPLQGHVINPSNPQGQDTIHGAGMNVPEQEYARGSNKEQGDLVVSEKGKKGNTGVYGGGNVAHRPHQEKSSATPRPYLFAKTMLHLSFSLVLMIFFLQITMI